MKINVKTLKGTDFIEINLDESATVELLKEKIAEDRQKDKDTIKLVHKGKQLNDGTKTLGEIGIKDNDFIILMFFVKKVEKSEESSSSTVPPPQNPVTNVQVPPVKPATNEASSVSNVTTSQQQPASTAAKDNNDLLQGPELEEKIKELQDMGFERAQVLKALKAAYFNPERAVEYLLSGNIPEQPVASSAGQRLPQQGQGQNPEILQQFAQLAQNPQFQQIALAIRANPNLLQPMLTQLAQTNPEIARTIASNPQEFIQLIFGQSQEGGAPRGGIQVTLEEKADIDEIISLGFNKNDALEAYISCDKNKELAINYLFDARENGTLLSEHIQKEETEQAQQQSLNPQSQSQPPSNQNNPPKDDKDDKDDDDDFLY